MARKPRIVASIEAETVKWLNARRVLPLSGHINECLKRYHTILEATRLELRETAVFTVQDMETLIAVSRGREFVAPHIDGLRHALREHRQQVDHNLRPRLNRLISTVDGLTPAEHVVLLDSIEAVLAAESHGATVPAAELFYIEDPAALADALAPASESTTDPGSSPTPNDEAD